MDVEKISVDGFNLNVSDAKARDMISDKYDPDNGTYVVGDTCINDDVLYICNTDIDTPEDFDSTKWDATTIADIIANLRIDANDVVDVKVKGDSLVNSSKIAVLDSLTAQGSASGSIASFSDGSTYPMSKLEIGIEPQQDLHGYDAPWAGGAGKNKLQVTATTQTINGVTFTVNDDGTVLVNGTASDTAILIINNISNLGLTDGTQYILSGCSGGTSNTYKLDILKDSGAPEVINFNGDTTFTKSAILNREIRIVVYSGVTVNNIVFKPMIRLASETDATFEPYSNICPISGHTEANVTRCGKNIATTEIYKNNYVLAVDGAENYASGFIITKEIKINSSNNYYISMVGGQTSSSDAIRVGYYDGNFNFIARESEYSPSLLRMHDNAEYIRLSYRNIDPYFKDIQIEVGTEATAYEAYNGQTYNVEFKDGDNPLTVYGGTLDVVSGELVVDKAMVVLNGGENWALDGKVSSFNRFYIRNDDIKKYENYTSHMICNECEIAAGYAFYGNVVGDFAVTAYTIMTNNYNYLYVAHKTIATVEALKTYLSQHPLQVVYELATPQSYQLTPTQVKSLLGTNNVWADTGGVNEVVYTRDLNTTVNDIISRIEALENA